jgi:hypothetical protein
MRQLSRSEPGVTPGEREWVSPSQAPGILSKRQVLKVRGWEKDGHSVMPMWFTNCERVLFLDQERFEEWLLEEGKR